MQQQKEKLKLELVAIIEEEGIGKVSERVGISTQGLRDIRSGKNAVTLDTLLAFSREYPGKFAAVIEEVFDIKAPPSDNSAWEERYLALEKRYEALEEKHFALEDRHISLMDRYNALTDQYSSFLGMVMAKLKLEPSFNWSGSHTTVEEIIEQKLQEWEHNHTIAAAAAKENKIGFTPEGVFGPQMTVVRELWEARPVRYKRIGR